jgi:tetratricopeptide (TPR) repeat protein
MSKWAVTLLCLCGAAASGQDVVSDLMTKYENEIRTNPHSSIAHFRIAEVYFQRRNYQAAANEFRESLNGDLQPRWVDVWAHLNLGKIFDSTGQRERALNEYRQVQRTQDNTRGALDEAEILMQVPYPKP